MDSLDVAAEKVWTPELRSFKATITHMYARQASVRSSGVVREFTFVKMTVPCQMEAKYWPWDEQQCAMVFLTQYNGEIVEFNRVGAAFPSDLFEAGGEWTAKLVAQKKSTPTH